MKPEASLSLQETRSIHDSMNIKKLNMRKYATNEDADQSVHPRSLTAPLYFYFLEIIITLLDTHKL